MFRFPVKQSSLPLGLMIHQGLRAPAMSDQPAELLARLRSDGCVATVHMNRHRDGSGGHVGHRVMP